jgi:acetyl-CoA carboxylase biotin carboxyl carrier protein
MNIKEVKDLIHEVLQSDICEFELDHTGTKIRLKRGVSAPGIVPAVPHYSGSHSLPATTQSDAVAASAIAKLDSADEDLHLITSPIVGTFYRASSPEIKPFVKVGDSVEEGTILCIVEAMKLMNEIPSDQSGEIVRIFVENGNPVEFGQHLFAIRPRK